MAALFSHTVHQVAALCTVLLRFVSLHVVAVCHQVQHLAQTPMSLICKMAPVLSDDVLGDIMPVAWELLLAADQELAASAGQYHLHA